MDSNILIIRLGGAGNRTLLRCLRYHREEFKDLELLIDTEIGGSDRYNIRPCKG